LKIKDIEFVNIDLEKKKSFLPEIKVNLDLEEILNRLKLY
jgi:hypothetical protein